MTHSVTFESLDLSMPGGTCDAYLAHPSGGGPWPRVLLIMDAVGLRPRIADMVSRVASWGYAVLAPNTFYRVGRQPLVDPTLLTAERRADRRAGVGLSGRHLQLDVCSNFLCHECSCRVRTPCGSPEYAARLRVRSRA